MNDGNIWKDKDKRARIDRMKFFAKPELAKILRSQKDTLDKVFGMDKFQIWFSHEDEAKVETERLEIVFGRDNRDGDIGVLLTLKKTAIHSDWVDGPFQWAKFLGDEARPKKRNSNGKILATAYEQIRDELELIERLEQEIFSDTSRTRDAINWLEGYRVAYNESAAGDWD